MTKSQLYPSIIAAPKPVPLFQVLHRACSGFERPLPEVPVMRGGLRPALIIGPCGVHHHGCEKGGLGQLPRKAARVRGGVRRAVD